MRWGAVLGHVVGVDVDSGIGGFLNKLDAGGLAVGAGDTVGLAFGSGSVSSSLSLRISTISLKQNHLPRLQALQATPAGVSVEGDFAQLKI